MRYEKYRERACMNDEKEYHQYTNPVSMNAFWNILQQWTNCCMDQFYYLFTNSIETLFGYEMKYSMTKKASTTNECELINVFVSVVETPR